MFKLNSVPLLKALSIAIPFWAISSSAIAAEFCEVQNPAGEIAWDIADNGTGQISFMLTAGDEWTAIKNVSNARIRGKHQYVGDLAASIISPSATEVVLFRLGDGRFGESFSNCYLADFDIAFSDTASGTDLSVADEANYCVGTNDRTPEGSFPQPYLPNFPNVGNSPGLQGTALTYNSEGMTGNKLSNFIGDDPLAGPWKLEVLDAYSQDFGTLEEACVDMDFGSVTYDIWVSSDETCSDELDTGTFNAGETVNVCYIASNEATQDFNLVTETNNHGQTLNELKGDYTKKFGGVQTIKTTVRTFIAGDATLPLGITTLTGEVRVNGSDTYFPPSENLISGESVEITVIAATANLTLVNTVINDDGGVANAADWILSYTDGGTNTGSGATGTAVVTSASVLAGTYTVFQNGPADYTQTGVTCTGGADTDLSDGLTLTAGEDVTCTFIQEDNPPPVFVAGPSIYIGPDNVGQVAPCGINDYLHVLRNEGNTAEDVVLSISNQSLLTSILQVPTALILGEPDSYVDLNLLTVGNQIAILGEAGWGLTSLIDDGVGGVAIPLQPSEQTRFINRITASCGQAAAGVDVVNILAMSLDSDAQGTLSDTTVISNARVDLEKLGALDVSCDLNADTAYDDAQVTANPGNCILWNISLSNSSAQTVCDVSIKDKAPAFTSLFPSLPVLIQPTPGAGVCTTSATELACTIGNSVDADGDGFAEDFCLKSGEGAQVTFAVKID